MSIASTKERSRNSGMYGEQNSRLEPVIPNLNQTRKRTMAQTQPLYEAQVDHQVPVPMRDGTILSAEVYRPKGEGKWPVIVTRNGYDPLDSSVENHGDFFTQHGYVFVFNNTRG